MFLSVLCIAADTGTEREGENMDELIHALQPHPEDRLHLRLHRARSVVLTAQEYVSLFPLLYHPLLSADFN